MATGNVAGAMCSSDVAGIALTPLIFGGARRGPKTESYAEIARAMSTPKGMWAEAGACGSNNIAVAIPCHRLVSNDGSVSGYAWRWSADGHWSNAEPLDWLNGRYRRHGVVALSLAP